MTQSANHRLAVFSTVLTVVTYALLVFGSSVRVHGAGLACPDWPLCFGEVIPALDFQVFLEWGHRVLAGGVSLGYVALMWAVFRDGERRSRIGWLTAIGALVLATQVVLGGLTVLELLAEWTVASHLTTGNTFCLILLLHALFFWDEVRDVRRQPVTLMQRLSASQLVMLVPAQLVLGGLVAASHAGLACGTWPGCNGPTWFPTFEGIIGLQVMHRIVAYTLVTAAVLNLAVNGLRGRVGRASLLVTALIVGQACLGIANVLLRMPVEVTLLHSAGAAAIVLATTWLQFEVWRAPLEEIAPTGHIAMEGK